MVGQAAAIFVLARFWPPAMIAQLFWLHHCYLLNRVGWLYWLVPRVTPLRRRL